MESKKKQETHKNHSSTNHLLGELIRRNGDGKIGYGHIGYLLDFT